LDGLLDIALGNAAMAAILALVAAAIGRLCRRPALAHALWVLVLIKLVTPPLWKVPMHGVLARAMARAQVPPRTPALPVTPISPGEIQQAAPKAICPTNEAQLAAIAISPQRETAEVVELPEPVRRALNWDARADDLTPASTVRVAEPAAVAPIPPAEEPVDYFTTANVIWGALYAAGAGSGFCGVIVVVRLVRFRRLLRYAMPAPAHVRGRMESLALRMGVSPPSAWLVPGGTICPMVFALGGRPWLLIPDGLWERLNPVQQSALLVHELAHLHRRDHWVRWLEVFVTIFYWWHPAVWWARRELRDAEEQCCDAWVVWLLPGANRNYAAALLDTLEFISAPSPADAPGVACNLIGRRRHRRRPRHHRRVPSWASGMGEFHRLKRRLLMIKTAKVSRRLTGAGLTSVFALAGLLLPVAPGFGEGPKAPELAKEAKEAKEAAPATEKPTTAEEKIAADEVRVIEKLRTRKEALTVPKLPEAEPLKVELLDNNRAVLLKPVTVELRTAEQVLLGDGETAPDAPTPQPPGAKRDNADRERDRADRDRDRAERDRERDRDAQMRDLMRRNQDQERQLQQARNEVQKLSSALQGATQRLKEMEMQHASMMKQQADFMAANAMGDKRNVDEKHAYVTAKPGGGAYSVTSSDGKVTVFSPDGKIMSVTEARPGTTSGYAIVGAPAPMPANGLPGQPAAGPTISFTPAAVPPAAVAPVAPGGPALVGQPGYPGAATIAPVPAAPPGPRNVPELEQRLQRLEAQINALSQELRSLHKEISASRQPMSPDQPQKK
jgi:TolA-binding protein